MRFAHRLVAGAVSWLATGLIGLPSAHASAGVACRAEDATLVLSLNAAFGRALGAGIANFGATLAIRMPHAPSDLRALKFGRDALSQSWWHERSLNFALHRDREVEPNGSVDLIIETTQRAGEENRYEGRYLLSIAPAPGGAHPSGAPQEWRGAVTCTTD
jgi:hypothetical protein